MNDMAPPVIEPTDDMDSIDLNAGHASMAVQLSRAEIDQQIATARAYPRSLTRVRQVVMNMVTLDPNSIEECMYALPRGGKPIRGPSVRFAEILKQAYGNCRAAARVVHVDRTEMYVEAEGVFHDLETNSATSARIRRRISDKNGRLFSDDMIIVTGNAACAIAKRNAILDGIPRPLWRTAYETVVSTITGDITTLAENREAAFKGFATYGATPEMVCAALGRGGPDDIMLDDISVMRGMFSALKNGEATVEEMFARPGGKPPMDRGSMRERFNEPEHSSQDERPIADEVPQAGAPDDDQVPPKQVGEATAGASTDAPVQEGEATATAPSPVSGAVAPAPPSDPPQSDDQND